MNNIITQSFVFLLAVSTLDAATIAWEGPVRILSPNDVSTTGTLLEALNIQDNESSPLDVTLKHRRTLPRRRHVAISPFAIMIGTATAIMLAQPATGRRWMRFTRTCSSKRCGVVETRICASS